jgi:lysophospholipase L1-like esterase
MLTCRHQIRITVPSEARSVSTQTKKALFAAIAITGSLVFALLIAEVAVRILQPIGDLQYDPWVIRSLVPNSAKDITDLEPADTSDPTKLVLRTEKVKTGTTSTNNIGFRMLDDVGEKGPDERRVLLFGDSYLEAREVDSRSRFSEIVSKRLDKETDGRWKVLNGGIRTGSTVQYLMQLHQWAEDLKPDLVVVFVGANDAPDDYRTARRYGVVTDDDGIPIHPEKQFSLWAVKTSHLVRFLAKFSILRMPTIFKVASPEKGEEEKEVAEMEAGFARGGVYAWIELACESSKTSQQNFVEGTGNYLRLMRDASRRIGADFAVVLLHYSYYFPDEPVYLDRWSPSFAKALSDHKCVESEGRAYETFLRDFLRENDIQFASTYDRFLESKRQNPNKKLWHYYDYHFNEAGHALAAEDLHLLLKKMIAARDS